MYDFVLPGFFRTLLGNEVIQGPSHERLIPKALLSTTGLRDLFMNMVILGYLMYNLCSSNFRTLF